MYHPLTDKTYISHSLKNARQHQLKNEARFNATPHHNFNPLFNCHGYLVAAISSETASYPRQFTYSIQVKQQPTPFSGLVGWNLEQTNTNTTNNNNQHHQQHYEYKHHPNDNNEH